MSKKKVPNPNGKKGGKLHQDKINEIENELIDSNLTPDREHFFKNTNGKSRFADIVGFNEKGDMEEIHQVGKQNKNGTPVKRERDAMADIEKMKNKKVIFHPYNIIAIVALVLMATIWFY